MKPGIPQQPDPFMRRACRIHEACVALGISRSTLYKLVAEGKLRLIHLGGRSLIPATEIDRLISNGSQ
jgi:excisionase family DNA binding protein